MNSTLDPKERREVVVLLAAIFVIAACGMVYELLIGSLSAYLEGDSVTHFSITVGCFMAAMGLGSWLSRYVDDAALLPAFVGAEVLLSVAGGLSGLILFSAYALVDEYLQVMVAVTVVCGALVGIELPLLARVFKRYGTLALTLSTVLSFDYVGGLAAALLFPFILMPHFGAVRTGLLFGILNGAVALATVRAFRDELGPVRRAAWNFRALAALAALGFLLVFSQSLVGVLEASVYSEEVVYARTTPWQRIVVTKWRENLRLFLDGQLQFSTLDEHRYHEALVHPAMLAAARHETVAILGGGDGLAAREVLKYADVRSLHVCDLDPAVTDLARTHPDFLKANGGSLADPRVTVVNEDARKFLLEWPGPPFDVIVIDLPDPNDESLARLYSVEFYRLVAERLARAGTFVAQSTSPYFSPESFWMIRRTIAAAGLHATPLHAYVPSFGEWGFVLGSPLAPATAEIRLPAGMAFKFLDEATLRGLFAFAPDMAERGAGINRFASGDLLRLYLAEWDKWN